MVQLQHKDVFVGLDYHTNSVQVCVVDQSGRVLCNRSVRGGPEAVVGVAEGLGSVRRVAIESCGGAAEMAQTLVETAGWSVDLAHPGYVNRMKQNPDKTDYSDARMLAELTRVGFLPRVWLAPRVIRELRSMVRLRQQYVDQRRAVKLRIRALLREYRIRPEEEVGAAWTKRWLAWLARAPFSESIGWVVGDHVAQLEWIAEQIKRVEKRLELVTRGDQVVERLQTMPGIGSVTSWVLRAEIGRFDRFRSGKQLARYCGLTPRNASSGERQADAGLIKAGNTLLRATLIEAAHRLAMREPRWVELGRSLRKRGKPGSVVAAAIANRWVRALWSDMMKAGVFA